MTTNKREDALRFLYKHLRESKTALGHAETRQGVKQEELDNLQTKIDILDYLTTLVNKEPVEEE